MKRLPDTKFLANPSGTKLGTTSEYETNPENNNKESLWTAKRMAIVMLSGFGVGFVYYRVQLNVENLNFNLYISVTLNALMKIPAVLNLISSFLLGFTNRRLLFCVSTYMAGISCIFCTFLSGKASNSLKVKKMGGNWAQLIVEGIGFMGPSTAFDILYVYCVEIFPTNVRNFSVSMLRQALVLGASMAPLVAVVGRLSPPFSSLVFGLLWISSGLMSLCHPETRNAP